MHHYADYKTILSPQNGMSIVLNHLFNYWQYDRQTSTTPSKGKELPPTKVKALVQPERTLARPLLYCIYILCDLCRNVNKKVT